MKVLDGLASVAVRARWWVVAAAAAVAVAGAVLAGPTFGRLAAGGFDDPGSESTKAAGLITAELGVQAPDVLALYSHTRMTVDDPAFRTAVHGAERRLASRPEVIGVSGYYDNGGDQFVTQDRHETYLAIQLRATDDTQRRKAFDDIKGLLTAQGLTTRIGGDVAVQADGDEITARDVERGELLTLPILLLLLVLIFRSLVAAVIPLFIGLLAIAGAFVTIRVIESLTTVSTFAINTITLLGLGMAIDYALIIVSRFREQLKTGATAHEAVRATLGTAGRTVLVSGLTVTLSLASLLVFPEPFLKSMAYGGMAAVFIAMLSAVTVLPAVLALLGARIDALALPRRWMSRVRTTRHSPSEGAWARIAMSVMRRPVVAVLAVVFALLALAAPVRHLQFGGFDQRVLPSNSQARNASDHLSRDFPGLAHAPIQVLVEGASPATLRQVVASSRALPGLENVSVAATNGEHALLVVGYAGGSGSSQARGLVADLRAMPTPPGVRVLVTGPPAEITDQLASLGARLPWMLGVMAGVTLVLLFLAFGSVVLPVKAVIVNVLSVAASFGVLVWGFQGGHLQGLLGFTPTGDLEPTTLVLVLAVLFGLATDYEVFLLSRVREEWERGQDSRGAVVRGLQRTGGLITSAALLLGVVCAGFATGDIALTKLIGVGMVAGLALDAVLVRTVLVPAAMGLLGRTSWWLPRFLATVHGRFGLREEPESRPARSDRTLEPQPEAVLHYTQSGPGNRWSVEGEE